MNGLYTVRTIFASFLRKKSKKGNFIADLREPNVLSSKKK